MELTTIKTGSAYIQKNAIIAISGSEVGNMIIAGSGFWIYYAQEI